LTSGTAKRGMGLPLALLAPCDAPGWPDRHESLTTTAAGMFLALLPGMRDKRQEPSGVIIVSGDNRQCRNMAWWYRHHDQRL